MISEKTTGHSRLQLFFLCRGLLFLWVFAGIYCGTVQAQLTSAPDSLEIEKLRTESGVDPTRVNSRVGFSSQFFDQDNNRGRIVNKASMVLGIDRWSISIKPELVSLLSGVEGAGFTSGFGDLKFSLLNAFFVKGKHALAASSEFSLPVATKGFGSEYFSVTPALTYSYTFNPGLILAVQPQYSFSVLKDPVFPDLSVFTVRSFLARFTKTGLFYVAELRPVYDITAEKFDLIASPILGKALGAGFNLVFLSEIPLHDETRSSRGILYQLGFNKNF